MAADGNVELADDDIINLVNAEGNYSNDDDSDAEMEMPKDSSVGISHAEGLKAIETTLAYMQEQKEITLAETIMMRKWKEMALCKKLNSTRQSSITDFFKK
ncbi:hypothetical protein PGB90_008146 [Kerria lacca]